MTTSDNRINVEFAFHQSWARGIEWIVVQHTRLLSLRNEWSRRRKYRSDLRRLLATGPHLITDIGMQNGEALREASKPFWVG